MTFALPVEEHLLPHQLPLVVGLAVREAAAELCGDPGVRLKWPNDLLYEGRKLAGLLCERVDKADLIGLGLNVNLDPRKAPPALRETVTSLRAIAGREFDLTDVVAAVGRHLRRTLSSRHTQLFPTFLREYDRHHALVGRVVTIIGQPDEPQITGRCLGLDDMGRLLVKDRRTTHAIIAGHVVAR